MWTDFVSATLMIGVGTIRWAVYPHHLMINCQKPVLIIFRVLDAC